MDAFRKPSLIPKAFCDQRAFHSTSPGLFRNRAPRDLGAQSNSSPDLGQLLRTGHRRNKSRGSVQDPNGYKSPNRDIKLVNGYGPGPGRPPTDWKPQRSRQLVRLVLDSDIPLADIPAALKDGDFHPCKTSCRTQFIKLTGVKPDQWRLHDPKKKEVRKGQMIEAMNVARSREAPAEASLPSEPFPVALVPQQETHSQYPVDSSNFTFPSSDLSSTSLTPSVSSFHQLETASFTDSAICFNLPGDWTNDFVQNIPTVPNSSGIISNVKSDSPATFRKQHMRKVSAPGDLEGAVSKHTRWPSKAVQGRLYEFIKKRLSISRSSIASAVSLSGSIRSRWSNRRTSSQRLANRQSTGTSAVMHEINATPTNNITDAFEHFSGENYDYVTALLKIFHQRGASVDGRNSKGETALHIAAGHGNISACEFLLRECANVYAITSTGESISAYTKSKSRRAEDPARYAKIKVCRNMIKEHEMGKPLKIRSPLQRKRNAVAVTSTAQETCHESSTTWIDDQLTSSPISSISVIPTDGPLSGEMDASQAPWNIMSRGIAPLGVAPPVNMGNHISPNFDDTIFSTVAPTPNSFRYPPSFVSLSQQSAMTVNPPTINPLFRQIQWEDGSSEVNFIPDGSERICTENQMVPIWANPETIEAGITDADMDNALAVTSQYGLDPGYQAGFELTGEHTASTPFGNTLQGITEQYDAVLAHTPSNSRFSNLPALDMDTQGGRYSMELSPRQLLPGSGVNYPPTSAHGRPVSPLYEEVPSTFEDSNISFGDGVTFGDLNMNAGSWEEFWGQRWS